MRTARALLGGHWLSVWVAETLEEQQRGLQGFPPLRGSEGMYFPREPPGPMRISMMSVAFPIDVLFFRRGRLAKIIRNLEPGDRNVWTYGDWHRGECSGVLELRGGWVRDRGLDVVLESPLLVSV